MRFLRLFAAGLLGAGALYGLFLAYFCLLPKIAQAEIDQNTSLPSWISIPASASPTGDWTFDLFYLLTAIFVIAFIVACLPFVGPAVQNHSRNVIYFLAFGTSAVSMSLLIIAAAGMIFVNSDLSSKNHVYASVLDQFSLRESADGKFDQIQTFLSHVNSMRMIEVSDATLLTYEQRQEQIRGLLYGIKASKDVPFLKQVLATSDKLKEDIIKNQFQAKAVLEAAALCGAPADDINKFYAWLEPKIGTEGWNPVPLHIMVFDK